MRYAAFPDATPPPGVAGAWPLRASNCSSSVASVPPIPSVVGVPSVLARSAGANFVDRLITPSMPDKIPGAPTETPGTPRPAAPSSAAGPVTVRVGNNNTVAVGAALETLRGARFEPGALVVQADSSGCTREASFAVHIADSEGPAQISLTRETPDTCEALAS